MPKTSFLSLFLCVAFHPIFAQDHNLNFEQINPETKTPLGWDLGFRSGGAKGYLLQIDSTYAQNGLFSLSMEADPATDNRTFGACALVIPATFAGKNIELTGYIKTENIEAEGFANLWMRIDSEDGTLQFDNMNDRNVTGTNDWKAYTISLPLDEEAYRINIGGLIGGNTGKAWFDNFTVLVDGKPFSAAPPKQVKVYPASQDTAFSEGSGISITQLDEQQSANLVFLGKVWGFLKYYHPDIAAGNWNWDNELFRFLPNYLKASNLIERDLMLLQLLKKLPEVSRCISCPDLFEGARHYPDLEWIDLEEMDSRLKNQLGHIRDNRNQEKHYYVKLAPNVGNPIFLHENPYPQFEYPDAGYRLLALYRYWNIIQYFFPYKYVIGENWNEVLSTFVPRFLEAKDALEYRLVALELIGRINDTHANIWSRDSHLVSWKGELSVPVQIKFIENKAVVTGYYDQELGEKTTLKPGDVITAVEGQPVADIIEKRLPYYPASNYPTKLRDIARSFLKGNNPTVEVTVNSDGKIRNLTLERSSGEGWNFRKDWAHNMPDSCYRMIDSDIGYIYLGNIKSELLPTIFEQFKDTKGIIIDIRNYPSEFVVFSLGQYLVPESTEFVKFTKGDIHSPGRFDWTDKIAIGDDNPDYYQGKVVILINEISQSQAEYTTMAFRTAPKATVIGSTTAGADGNISPFYLPGNLRTMISGIGVFYPDGTATQRVGIVPDIEVKPTIQGIKEGRDELLEKAIEVIKNP